MYIPNVVYYHAVILSLESDSLTTACVETGIKKNEQIKFNSNSKKKGSNGTYASGHNTIVFKYLKIKVSGNKGQIIKIDVYEAIKKYSKKQRISNSYLQKIFSNIEKNIEVFRENGVWKINDEEKLIEDAIKKI